MSEVCESSVQTGATVPVGHESGRIQLQRRQPSLGYRFIGRIGRCADHGQLGVVETTHVFQTLPRRERDTGTVAGEKQAGMCRRAVEKRTLDL